MRVVVGAVLLSLQAVASSRSLAMFKKWDTDGDARLTIDELRAQATESESPRDVERDFAYSDVDGDGHISYDEFRIRMAGESIDGVTMSIRVANDPAPRRLQELHLRIIIQNQGSTSLEPARLWFVGGGFDRDRYTETPKIRPGQTQAVEMVLSSRYNMELDQIPHAILIDLKRRDGTIIAGTSARTDLSWFVSALGPPLFEPASFNVERFNVLIFGPKGSGKSSFINSVHSMTQSATDGEAMKKFVPEHGGNDHCTVRYHMIEGMTTLPLAFWDTWGVSLDRYNGNELELMMQGKLPAGWSMDDNVLLTETDEAVAYNNRPHAVIFMLPVDLVFDPESEQMQKIVKEFAKIIRLGVNPLVLLASVDVLDESIRKDPSTPPDSVKNAIKAASKILGIGQNSIFPSVNYLEEKTKTFEIDRNLWTIVHRALSDSKHYLQYLERQAAQTTNSKVVVPIQQKLNELQAQSARCEMRAEESESSVRDLKAKVTTLKVVVEQLEEKVNSCKQKAEKARGLAATHESRAGFWKKLFCTLLIVGCAVICLFNPSLSTGMLRIAHKAVACLTSAAGRLAQTIQEKLAQQDHPAHPPNGPVMAERAEPVAPASAVTAHSTADEVRDEDERVSRVQAAREQVFKYAEGGPAALEDSWVQSGPM